MSSADIPAPRALGRKRERREAGRGERDWKEYGRGEVMKEFG
jgi:hypothetical protein